MEREQEKCDPYQSKSDEFLKDLALRWVTNQIFTSDQVGDRVEMQMVFMPLVFMNEDHLNWMRENKITLLYEEVRKAGPRGINGMPMFMSMQMLNEEDHKKFYDLSRKMDQALDNVEPEGTNEEDPEPVGS